MRIVSLLALIAACSGDDGPSPDALTGNHPAPEVIPGGGIGGGAIDGVVNLYVIDDATRLPIAGATVSVGGLEGSTDADGLFVAEGLVGKQDVVVTAAGYRAEMWLGANGANLTANLQASMPTIAQATLTGTITDFSTLSVAGGHVKVGLVLYSQDDKLTEAANNLKTADDKNLCIVGAGDPCNFEIVTRTGSVSLLALIFDRDLNGTPLNPADDTQTLIAYAARTGITVAAGTNQTAQDLTLVPPGMLATETVDFGTPPAGLTAALGLVGIELGDGSGVFHLPVTTPAATSAPVPALAYFPGSMYRLTAIAQNSAMPPTQSFVLRRKQTGATLSAGMWTDPPTSVSLTRTHASWTASPTGTVHGVEYLSDTAPVLNISSFDGTSAVDIPELVALPGGPLTGKVQALTAVGLDLGDLALDRDREKITGAAAVPSQVN